MVWCTVWLLDESLELGPPGRQQQASRWAKGISFLQEKNSLQ